MKETVTPLTPISLIAASLYNKNLRYINHRVYLDPDTKERFLQLFKQNYLSAIAKDVIVIVTNKTAFRPDLISYNQYNTPFLAWLVCYVNAIKDPYSRKTGLYAGREIALPDLTTVALKIILR